MHHKFVFSWLPKLFFLILLGSVFISTRLFSTNQSGNWQIYDETPFGSKGTVYDSDILKIHKNTLFINNQAGYTAAYHLKTGQLLWKFFYDEHAPFPPTIIDDQYVAIASFDSKIYLLNIQTGDEVWRFNIPNFIQPDTGVTYYPGSQLLYFGARDGKVYALHKQSGEKYWEHTTTGIDLRTQSKESLPLHFGMLFQTEKIIIILSATENKVIAVDKDNGKTLWEYGDYLFFFEEPIFDEVTLFVKSNTNELLAIELETGQLQWKKRIISGENSSIITPEKNRFFPAEFGYLSSRVDELFLIENTTLHKLNKITGNSEWMIHTSGEIGRNIQSTHQGILFSHYVPGNESRLLLVDRSTGQTIWQHAENGNISQIKILDETYALIGKHNGQLEKVSLDNGEVEWQRPTVGSVEKIWPLRYQNKVVSFNMHSGGNGQLYFHDLDGNSLFTYHGRGKVNRKNIQWLETGVGFLDDEKRLLTFISIENGTPLSEEKIPSVNFYKKFEADKDYYSKISQPHPNQSSSIFRSAAITFISPRPNLKVYQTDGYLVLQITQDEKKYLNPFTDANIRTLISDSTGETHQVKGFYYDKNTWRIIFRPSQPGTLRWQVIIQDPFSLPFIAASETAIDLVDQRAGLILDEQNQQLRYKNGDPFWGLGLQDVIIERNYNGTPLDQWAIGTTPLPKDNDSYNFVSMNEYFSYYGKDGAGMNFFRFGIDNVSPILWKQFGDEKTANKYKVNEGKWGDLVTEAAANQDMRIMMTIFGFNPPFPEGPQNSYQREALRQYLDYVVARYGHIVDIWELMNEATVAPGWIQFVSTYLRSIDPYQRPITTNWEQPDLSKIELASVHLYSKEPDEEADVFMKSEIDKYSVWQKPVIFSELGNQGFNWDETSVDRLRLKLWTAFFMNAHVVLWNTSDRLYFNPTNSNVYLGTEEVALIKAMQKIITKDWDTRKLINNGERRFFSDDNLRVYSLQSNTRQLTYFVKKYSQSELSPQQLTQLLSDQPQSTYTWIAPDTGNILAVTNTAEKIPSFTKDILLLKTITDEDEKFL